jgi:hypothetical protein
VQDGTPVHVVEMPVQTLQRASAAALSNARMGLVMVDELDGRQLAHSARLLELAARVASLED